MTQRICIVINSLVQGGAQKSAILLAKELYSAGNDLQILTFYPEETDFFEVPKGIEIRRFIYPFQDKGRSGRNIFNRRIKRIKNRIKDFRELQECFSEFNPDLVISFEAATSVLAYFANKNSCPIIISERIHPAYHRIPYWARILRPYVYKSKNSILHCQGKQIAAWMDKEYKKMTFVIPNFLGGEVQDIWSNKSKKIKVFSRYSPQKGIDLAIESWAKLPIEIREDFTLEIYGDGDASPYQKIVEKHSLNSSVKLLGPTKNVKEELSDCLIFLMPSRFEGFPNSLTEAMSFGIPSLVTDCPSAIREITLNGKLARLTLPTTEALSENLYIMLADKDLQFELNQLGPQVSNYFSDTNTLLEWLDLIDWVIGGRKFKVINCKSCRKELSENEIIGLRTKHGLTRELKVDWDIKANETEMGRSRIIAAYECTRCGTVSFSGEQGSEHFYDACYKSTLYSRKAAWDYEWIIDELKSYGPVKVLDFGGGISPLSNLNEEKLQLTVVDLSPSVREELERVDVECHPNLDCIPAGKKFDFIVFSHTIEHLDKPVELLHSLVDLLAQGGKIAITTPDAINPYLLDSPLAWPPHHTVAFKPSALKDLMLQIGLEHIEIIRNKDELNSKFDFMIIGVK
jgi:GalNAc-alpha-(1->4)-GalNAc-alpha-(1->3)-diNAcBac-PP-undecaprenol alpha-1,4-N-acetyl-D-galactosaminyltransferase